ncbi:protein SHORT-ROOT [Morus notabilis]|uniref:protein SHORT-ROOT n=1 Tax=Morus notabilis TaxID=981085 RepID=UPI000CED7F6A|nr:protein SHORT-ROOT [Morus notabilis]
MDITLFGTTPKEAQFLINSNSNNDYATTTTIGNMQTTTTINNHLNSHTSTSGISSDSVAAAAATEPWGGQWASRLLKECARAISEKDSTKIHHLLWMLNELSSPYGDCDQKLASYFLQALFCKATGSGLRCYRTLSSVAEKSRSFDSARKLILKFQEVTPWTTFGHVASNGAILEALEGEPKLHIIDISNTLCTQWPTLLEALATRNDETPRLRLTVVDVISSAVAGGGAVMKEIGQRMEKFARLMGVPFELNMISGPNRPNSTRLTREALRVRDDEAVAVNCVGALRRAGLEEREAAVRVFRSLDPKVVTIVEEEANMVAAAVASGNNDDENDFVERFEECLRFYTLYFEMLEESFSPTSNEKLMLERECSRGIVRALACGGGGGDYDDENKEQGEGEETNYAVKSGDGWDFERREKGTQWSERMKKAFSPVLYSDDVVDDVKALLKRYPSGWGLVLPQAKQQQQEQQQNDHGIYLTWKEEPVVWASAWKP